ncbi:MAG TPA: outer membrane protein assembly factor BamD [Candidatus Bathyarchaeia archaeon]|nr:outer membrane protein assembly factor BamD [Candidatus Bathyarchaeia archaeon]
MRRTLLAILGLVFLLLCVSAEAQTRIFKKKKKDAASAAATDNSLAPDKVLYDRALVDIKKGRHEVGRLNLQTLINTYPDSEYLAKAKLSIADSYYKEGGSANLTQAIAGYKDFIVFFPFLPEAPYAQIQVAMTHYKEMAKPDRDRTEAKAAEEEFQTFLAKYPKDPLVPKAEQHLREVQEVLAEGDFRIGYYYYVKGDRRASAGRLLSVTKRYPLYSRSDEALWMLGDIFEKSEKKEIASIYYARIVKEYPLSARVPDAKGKLVAFHVPVPQADPKALAWMQAEMSAPRPHEGIISKPMGLIHNGPGHEKMVAATHGAPNMEPENDTISATDILTGGGKSQLGAGGGSGATGNTAVVEIATPQSGASGGSTVESGDSGGTSPAATGTAGDAPATTPAATENAPVANTDTANAPGTTTAGSDANAAANNGATASTDPNAKPADNSGNADTSKESSSKKKKGLKRLVPW